MTRLGPLGVERAQVISVTGSACEVIIERLLPGVTCPAVIGAGLEVAAGNTVIVGAIAGRLDDLVVLAVL